MMVSNQNKDSDYHKCTLGNFISFVSQTATHRLKEDAIVLKKTEKKYWLNAFSQYPLFNGVFDFEHNEQNLSQQLEQAKDYFNQKPFTWWCLTNEGPSQEAQSAIEEAGFHSGGEYSGIFLDLENLQEINSHVDDIVVRKITSKTDYNSYCEILSETFQLPEPIQVEFEEMLNPFIEQSSYVHYLGFYQDKAASVLTTFKAGNTLGLYCGATLPNAREKGMCTALMAKGLKDARAQGCKTAVAQLMAKNMAGGIANKFGFKTVCHFTPYIYGANASELEP